MANKDNEILFGADFVRGDETDITYNFYQYQKSSGVWIILRTTKDTISENKYAVGSNSTFESAWTDRDSQDYNFPRAYPGI